MLINSVKHSVILKTKSCKKIEMSLNNGLDHISPGTDKTIFWRDSLNKLKFGFVYYCNANENLHSYYVKK